MDMQNKPVEGNENNFNLPDTSAHSGVAEAITLASDANSTEERTATKTILEDVCTDFESMDVITPKSNKTTQKLQINNIQRRIIPNKPSPRVINKGKSSDKVEVSNSNILSAAENVQLNTSTQSKISSEVLPAESMQESDCSSVFNVVESPMQASSEMLPLGDCENQQNLSIVTDSFPDDKNISSLAQLADAEIVQADGSVSIIITNPRLIKVMANSSGSSMQSTMINSAILGADIGATDQIGGEPTIISNFEFQDIDISADSSFLEESIVDGVNDTLSPYIAKKPEAVISNKVKKKLIFKGKGGKKATYKSNFSESGTTTRARRVTARMKSIWAQQLEQTGRLVCEMPGCKQTYVTVANFQTHYKYCTGKKNLQHCLYCDSLIFSSNKAVLQHMEVEHPDKVEEYKAKYPEETAEFEDKNLLSHLIVSEDENVAMNVEEVTQPQKNMKKRKLSAKENASLPQKTILKHKMKSIKDTVSENIKEFKKCVRFDNIVDKINSVSDFSKVVESTTEPKLVSKKKKRVILTESIVTEEKYFEDEDYIFNQEQEHESFIKKTNTKARMMLNMERYKRYKEYLKLTRDWSSERRTYSRSRASDSSIDSSYLLALQNEYIQDLHQMHGTSETSNISLDASQVDIQANDMSSIKTYEVIETENYVSVEPIHGNCRPVQLPSSLLENVRERCGNISLSYNEANPSEIGYKPSHFEENMPTPIVKREKVACYNRPSLPNSSVKIETPRPKKIESLITWGVMPIAESTPVAPPANFDSLVSCVKPKKARRNSHSGLDKNVNVSTNVENAEKHKKYGIKHPAAVSVETSISPSQPSRRKGKPPKPKVDVAKEILKSSNKALKSKAKKDRAKKYSAAMLKRLEANVRKRNAKLMNLKKASKLKCDLRKYVRMSQLRVNKSNLRGFQLKHSNGSSSLHNLFHNEQVQNSSLLESVIQCEENIDSHLPLNGVPENIPHVHALINEHSHIDVGADIIADGGFVVDANNVAGEIEVTSSNIELITEADKMEMHSEFNVEQCVSAQDAVCNSSIQGVENAEHPVADINLGTTCIESSKDSEGLMKNLEESAENQCKHLSTENEVDEIVTNLVDMHSEQSGRNSSNVQSEINVESNVPDGSEVVPIFSDANAPSSSVEMVHGEKDLVLNSAETREISAEIEAISAEVEAISAKVQEMSAKAQEDSPAKEISQFHEESNLNETPELTKLLPSSDTDIDRKLNVTKILDDNTEAAIEIPEVKVKRGRGRPRKNKGNTSVQNKSETKSSKLSISNTTETKISTNAAETEITEISLSNATETISPLQSTMDEENTPKINDDKEVDGSNEHSLVVDESTLAHSLRKSERVKKRKLVEIFETPKVEKKKEKDITPNIPVIRTGRRGRPRKYPPKDSDMNLSNLNDTLETPEKPLTPEVETEVVDENLRKYSRKGRPRKCVRYADLNSGVDSSESMDELNSGSRMKENTADDTDVETAQTVGDTNEKGKKSSNTENSSSFEQNEETMLPLKKRKKMKNKKNDSATENTSNETSAQQHPESTSCDSKKEKIINTDKSDIKKITPVSKNTRSLRSVVFKKQKNSGALSFKKKGMEKDYLDLDEIDEICDSLEKEDSSTRNLGDISEDASKISNKSASRSEDIGGASSLEPSKVLKYILSDFKPKKFMWKFLKGIDYYSFLPPLKNSVYFKIEKAWTEEEASWNSLSCFDSSPIDMESCHFTFFTGGPVLCSAWCPTPVDERTQYIAVAVSSSLNKNHSYTGTDSEKGSIQLWNVGLLSSKVLNSKPIMELGISHNHGLISDMTWCPSGCWEDPTVESSENNLPRLGMLAVACSDSFIRIYSIPHPNFLPKDDAYFPLYSSCPSIVLKPMYGGICMATKKSICACVTWQKSDNCERVAGGYGNGMICIWHINSTATILSTKGKDQTTINPYLVFNAHGTPVTSLSFAPLPGARFLVSSGSDKMLKFWDLIDTSLPFSSFKKTSSRSAEWVNHLCGVIASMDYGISTSSSIFRECGIENLPSRAVSNAGCCVLKSNLSEWMNTQALADLSGMVSVTFYHNICQDHVKTPIYFHRMVYQAEMKIVDGLLEKIAFSSYPESVDCLTTIQEMRDVVSAVDEFTDCDEKLQLKASSNILEEPKTAEMDHLLQTKNSSRKKRFRNELDEEVIIDTELSNHCSEISDIVSTISDMKDLVFATSELVQDIAHIVPAAKISEPYASSALNTVLPLQISSQMTEIVADQTHAVILDIDLYEKNETDAPVLINTTEHDQDDISVLIDTSENDQANALVLIDTSKNDETVHVLIDASKNDQANYPVLIETSENDQSDLPVMIKASKNDQLDEPVVIKTFENDQADVPVLIDTSKNDQPDVPVLIDAPKNYQADVPVMIDTFENDQADASVLIHTKNNQADVPVLLDTFKKNQVDVQVQNSISREEILYSEGSTSGNELSTDISDVLCNVLEEVSFTNYKSKVSENCIMNESESINTYHQSNIENELLVGASEVIDSLVIAVAEMCVTDGEASSSKLLEEENFDDSSKLMIDDMVDISNCNQFSNHIECYKMITNFRKKCRRTDSFLKTEEYITSNTEFSSKFPEVTDLVSHSADLVSLITDIKDIISTTDQLTSNNSIPPQILKTSDDHLPENSPGLVPSSLDVQADIFINYSECLSEPCNERVSENSSISEVICSLVRKVSEKIVNHPEVKLLSSRIINDMASQKESGSCEITMNQDKIKAPLKSLYAVDVTSFLKDFEDLQMKACVNEIESTEKWIENSRVINQCLEIRDLVSLVADMKDIISTMVQLTSENLNPAVSQILAPDSTITDVNLPLQTSISQANKSLPSDTDSPNMLNEGRDKVSNKNISSHVAKINVESNAESEALSTITDILCNLMRKVIEKIAHLEVKPNEYVELPLENNIDNCESQKIGESSEVLPDDIDSDIATKEADHEMEFCSDPSRKEELNAELPYKCSEILDIVSLVTDMKDVVSAVAQLASSNSNSPSDGHVEPTCSVELTSVPAPDASSLSQVFPDCKVEGDLAPDTSSLLQVSQACQVEPTCSAVLTCDLAPETSSLPQASSDCQVESTCCAELISDLASDTFSVPQASPEFVEDLVLNATNAQDYYETLCEEESLNMLELPENNTNESLLVVSDVLNCLIETVSEEKVTLPVACNTVTDIQLMDVEESVFPESVLQSISSDSAPQLESASYVMNQTDILCSETNCELVDESNDGPPKLSPENEMSVACNNNVPNSQSFSYDDTFNTKIPELQDETDDQVMLSADESSNSENDMDSDEDVEMDDSYLFDRESNYSGDSHLSECSLNSNISMDSSSCDSVSTDHSISPVPVDLEVDNLNSSPANQNNDCDKTCSQSPSVFSLISDVSPNLPDGKTHECDSLLISESLESSKIDSESTPLNHLNIEKSSDQITSDIVIADGIENQISTHCVDDKNVPESVVTCVSELCLKVCSDDNNSTHTVNITNETPVSQISNRTCDTVLLETPSETVSISSLNDNSDTTLNHHTVESTQMDIQTSDALCEDASDLHSNCTENVSNIHEQCTVIDSETNNEDCATDVNIENTTQNSNIVPESVNNIFETDISPETVCLNGDYVECLEKSQKQTETIPDFENRHRFSNKKIYLYENVIAEHGLVFKDMNTADFQNIEDTIIEGATAFPCDYHLASAKTVAWNPNFGSRFWLFSAGQSGIARLSYISDIEREKYFKRKDT